MCNFGLIYVGISDDIVVAKEMFFDGSLIDIRMRSDNSPVSKRINVSIIGTTTSPHHWPKIFSDKKIFEQYSGEKLWQMPGSRFLRTTFIFSDVFSDQFCQPPTSAAILSILSFVDKSKYCMKLCLAIPSLNHWFYCLGHSVLVSWTSLPCLCLRHQFSCLTFLILAENYFLAFRTI